MRHWQQPHQGAMLQELEDFRLIRETPAKTQTRSIFSMSHRHLQNCCSMKDQPKQTVTELWPSRTQALLSVNRVKGSNMFGKESNSSAEPRMLSIKLYTISLREIPSKFKLCQPHVAP